ncbi:hypothetical protein [Phenylobacterium sp. J367]|uniref:hypothetical protein n=1 Tax=Phenylobacterium sp. J367 TaxID=2898435 RepID=UPI002151DC8F|nr:hypothetical protein [Phenylobacterium sp. J367]MCR5879194.1 hypothetical protein [Phenylobacterium sp. J367]
MSSPLPLAPIIHAARAGALALAWRLYREAGLEGVEDAGALALKGRLLKDEARRAAERADRRGFWRRSAEAYLAAHALSGELYPLVNAATLARLAGETETARALAETVLATPPDPDETAYYRAATPAEALLVLGRVDEAKAALAAAIAEAPEAWADHASTLRQFELLLDALGEDAGWLDALRPPRPVSFAGHMAVAPDDAGLAVRVDAALAELNAGFGYGALAAGADIVVAEALLRRGAELHLVLPGPRAAFREASVARFGQGWAARFDAVMDAAASVRVLGGAAGPDHRLSLQLASEAAMGLAVMQARTLATTPAQLVVLDDEEPSTGEPGGSAWSRAAWAAAGRGRLDRHRRAPGSGGGVAGRGDGAGRRQAGGHADGGVRHRRRGDRGRGAAEAGRPGRGGRDRPLGGGAAVPRLCHAGAGCRGGGAADGGVRRARPGRRPLWGDAGGGRSVRGRRAAAGRGGRAAGAAGGRGPGRDGPGQRGLRRGAVGARVGGEDRAAGRAGGPAGRPAPGDPRGGLGLPRRPGVPLSAGGNRRGWP